MKITKIRSRWPETAGFSLRREHGADESILLHFLTPVTLWMDGRDIPVSAGTFVLFAAGTPHGFTSQGPLLHDWMHLRGDTASATAAFGLQPDTLYSSGETATVSELIATMETEFFAQAAYGDALLQALLVQLLITVARGLLPCRPRMDGSLLQRLQAARTQMLLHPDVRWTCAELARRACVSESRLFTAYRQAFGITPNRDLILIRLEKAKTYLSQGCSVMETAERTGYGEVFHFIRQFRALEGVTPKQYAQRLRQKPQ